MAVQQQLGGNADGVAARGQRGAVMVAVNANRGETYAELALVQLAIENKHFGGVAGYPGAVGKGGADETAETGEPGLTNAVVRGDSQYGFAEILVGAQREQQAIGSDL